MGDEEPEARPAGYRISHHRFAPHLGDLSVRTGSDGDGATVRRELDGVVNEVGQDLPEFVTVRLGVERLGGQMNDEVVAVARRGLPR